MTAKRNITAKPAKAVSIAVLGFALAAAVLGLVVPRFFGVKMLTIASDSMAPKYPNGTLIWVVPAEYDQIKEGDDVTYQLPTGMYSTHRVIAIDSENQTLTVQGLQLEFSNEIDGRQVVGVVRFSVKGLGAAMEALNRNP